MSQIVVSALGPSIGEQCASLGVVATGMAMPMVDRISNALTLAHIHGILTDAEIDRARTRLLKAARLKAERLAA